MPAHLQILRCTRDQLSRRTAGPRRAHTHERLAEGTQRQGVPPERISFVDALRWLATAQPGDPLPDLVVLSHRPGRVEPRVRKRRPKDFPVMKEPRPALQQELLAQRLAS